MIGARIGELRKSLGLAQAELAKLAGIAAPQISRYERGVSTPNDKALEGLAGAFKMDVAELLMPAAGSPAPGSCEKKQPAHECGLAVRVIGLAECGMSGWQVPTETSTYTMAPPDVHRGGFGYAVLAVGDSMIPAGIHPGFLVLVAPDLAPMPGDIVYVEDTGGHGTIKTYVGPSKIVGADFVALQGWLPKDPQDPDAPQKPFTMELAVGKIKRMHPVLYIKRRM